MQTQRRSQTWGLRCTSYHREKSEGEREGRRQKGRGGNQRRKWGKEKKEEAEKRTSQETLGGSSKKDLYHSIPCSGGFPEQRLKNVFCKRPHCKYSRLFRPYGFCHKFFVKDAKLSLRSKAVQQQTLLDLAPEALLTTDVQLAPQMECGAQNRVCIPNRFPSAVQATGPQTTLGVEGFGYSPGWGSSLASHPGRTETNLGLQNRWQCWVVVHTCQGPLSRKALLRSCRIGVCRWSLADSSRRVCLTAETHLAPGHAFPRAACTW